jgi:hypothetical protein
MQSDISNLISFLKKRGYLTAAFKRKIDKEVKKRSAKFEGKNIIWYGEKGHMAVVPIGYIEEMEGNIFYEDKLKQLNNLITYSDKKVQLQTSYGFAHQVDFTSILETQNSYYSGRFEIDYGGMQEPYTIGDSDLDKYIGSDEPIEDLLFDDWDIYSLLLKHKFDIVYNKMTEQQLIDVIKNAIQEAGESDDESITEYILYQKNIKDAIDSEHGDIGAVYIQLRDGHHRARAAIQAGERYICVDLSDEHLELARQKFTIL